MRRYRLLCILLAVDIALALAHLFLRKKLGFFDLDKEGSLKATYAGLQLLLTGGAAALLAYCVRTRARKFLWAFVSAGFFYLGLDDMMAIHERVGFVLNRWVGMTGYWGESFNWIIYFAPVFLVGALILFAAVRIAWKEERSIGVLFAWGLFLFLMSLVLEELGKKFLATTFYQSFVVAEELSQLIGGSCFLAGIVLLLRSTFDRFYTLRSTHQSS
ncbi:MAG: hypothetical protein Q7S16_03930 [bacterium]|nr:hypothetical protein [bacterium]